LFAATRRGSPPRSNNRGVEVRLVQMIHARELKATYERCLHVRSFAPTSHGPHQRSVATLTHPSLSMRAMDRSYYNEASSYSGGAFNYGHTKRSQRIKRRTRRITTTSAQLRWALILLGSLIYSKAGRRELNVARGSILRPGARA
jgi:hypothetical protein